MASINKITDIIAAIKTIYPYYAKDTDIKLLANTWNVLLKPYDDDAIDKAMYKCLQTCKMPPTPADVIEQIKSLSKALEPSDEELWAVYNKALIDTADQMWRFSHNFVDASGISQGQQARNKVEEIWEGLPDKIKRYLASKSELMRNARENNSDADFSTWEKQRFMKAMPIMEKRQEYGGMLLEGGNNGYLLGGSK